MLPEDAASSLRALESRSQRFLLDAIRQGAGEGSIRKDIDPETLLWIVSGTIHTLVGMPGLHQRATSDRRSEHVLDLASFSDFENVEGVDHFTWHPFNGRRESAISNAVAGSRFTAALGGALATTSLVLAGRGLYGLLVFAVVERRR